MIRPALYTCVKKVLLQEGIFFGSETVRCLDENEILESLAETRTIHAREDVELTDASSEPKVTRILVRAKRDSAEGWVTLVGSKGGVYVVSMWEKRVDDLQRTNSKLDKELKKDKQAIKKMEKDKEAMTSMQHLNSLLEKQVQNLTEALTKRCDPTHFELGQLQASILARSSAHHAKFTVKTVALSTPMAGYFSRLVEQSCVKHRTKKGSDTWEPAPILDVVQVDVVFNPRLQSKYELELNEIHGKLHSGVATIPGAERNKITRSGPFDADCQEYFLLHGSPKEKTQQIITGGLDPRRGGQSAGRLFGLASYLAVNASKADLYTDASKKEPETSPQDVRQIIVFRTACGDHHRVSAPAKELTLPPDSASGKPRDSVVAVTKQHGGCVDHLEIMIYRESQMLPVAVVSYRHVPTCACVCCLRRQKKHQTV